MGVDGGIYVLKVLDEKWWKNKGWEVLRNFIFETCEKEFGYTPEVFMPYYYKDFCGIKGLNVLIFYEGDYPMSFLSIGSEVFRIKKFKRKFNGKLEFLDYYEIWT